MPHLHLRFGLPTNTAEDDPPTQPG